MLSKPEILADLAAGLADDRAQDLRERVAAEVPRRLSENSQRLSIHYFLAPDAASTGFATVTAMAAELGDGAGRLFTAGHSYAGTALVRQLIECNYVLALMGENRAEAEAWMRASRDDILKTFMPRHMRQRSVRDFRLAEYQVHCDQGGHPNPAGRHLLQRLVADHDLTELARGKWLDLAEHLADVWSSFVDGLRLYDPRQDPTSDLYGPRRSPDGGSEIAALLSEWRKNDRLARPDQRKL